MPLFKEAQLEGKFHAEKKGRSFVHSLSDAFRLQLPMVSIEFNPPVVSDPGMREFDYWHNLQDPGEEEQKLLKQLKTKLRSLRECIQGGSFVSITDSAAGLLRIHNLALVRLFADPAFTLRKLNEAPLCWEPRRVLLHLTRNHSLNWVRNYLAECARLGFDNLLLITGDPLPEARLPTVSAAEALTLGEEAGEGRRLKNSVELLKFVHALHPDFYLGVAHNPFLKREAGLNHLREKLAVGARFAVTQPVSYYEECAQALLDLEQFRAIEAPELILVFGVFNYFVACNQMGYSPEAFEKQYKFWKRLFGYVPTGVREDYDRGLSGEEILARSLGKLKRQGHYYFDIMNAERIGFGIAANEHRLLHQSERFGSVFETESCSKIRP